MTTQTNRVAIVTGAKFIGETKSTCRNRCLKK